MEVVLGMLALRFIRTLRIALILATTTAACEAVAQASPDEGAREATAPSGASNEEPQGEYKQLIDGALKEYGLRHFERARDLMRRAHAIEPNARTLRGLGKIEFELRNYGESVKYLSEALASQVKPLSEPLRQETLALLERANAYVGRLHVLVDPHTASVMVDGVTVGSGPRVELALNDGVHVLELHALGRISYRNPITVERGKQESVHVVLEPIAVDEPRAASSDHHDDGRSRRSKIILWTCVGVAVAAVAAGVAWGVAHDRTKTETAAPTMTPQTQDGFVLHGLRLR